MAEIKKFMFDNFVVGRGDTKIPEPIPEVIEAEPVSVEEPFEMPEPEKEVEEIFYRADLEAQAAAADRAGYERGYAAAVAEQMTENNRLLTDISQKLTVLLAQAEDKQKQQEQEMADVIKRALQILVPPLTDDNASALVDKFLQDNFNNFKHNEKLSFYIHPDIISYIQESIVKLANSHDFEGKIAIHKDSSLEKSSCRVEWDNGGVEYAPEEQLKHIEQMLDKQ